MRTNRFARLALLAVALAVAGPALSTVSSTSSRQEYSGNGSTTGFAFTFPTQAASHVEVFLAGVKQTGGYTVALNANQATTPGGTVTFTSAPAAAVVVRVQRTVPLTQGTVYNPYFKFPAKTTEGDFDRAAMALQQVDRRTADEEAIRSSADAAEAATRAAKDLEHELALSLGNVGGSGTYITPTGSPAARTAADIAADAHGNPGRSLYVKSDTGNNSNTCSSWAYACATILGAYDKLPSGGGTIYIADQARVGGEVAGQGLWFIGTNDPLYATPPAGWRVEKAVHFIGATGQTAIQFSRPSTATFLPGTSGGWVYDKPAIHLAGSFAAMTFENLAVVSHPGTGLVIGLTTDYRSARAISMVASKWFLNCDFSVTPGTGADNGLIGPTVDIGYAFWIYFDDCVIHSNYFAPLGDDRHAAVRITDSGLQYFRRGRFAGGGIISYMPGLVVEDLMVESYGVALPPVVWLKNTANSSGHAYAIITNAWRADNAAGTYPDVQVDGGSVGYTGGYSILGARPSDIVISGPMTVTGGPATLLGGARQFNRWSAGQATVHPQSAQARNVGIANGRFFGRVNSHGRGFGPGAVRWPNLAPATAWVSNGTTTITATTGPDGRTDSAYHAVGISVGGPGSSVNRTVAVGDRLVFGAWVRLPNGGRAMGTGNNNGTLSFGDALTGNVLNGVSNSMMVNPGLEGDPGDGNWMWMWAAGVYTTVATASTAISFGLVIYDTAYPVDFYNPVLLHIPAAEISDNEFGDLIDSLSTYSSRAAAGDRAMRGDLFLEDGKLVVSNGGTGRLSVSAGSGTPEGAVTAPVGSLFIRSDGGAGTSLYVKESGVGNTGWTAK